MKAKRPDRYYQKAREKKREADIAFARRLGEGYISRHEQHPQDSDFWVEHGYWPKEENRS
jgi:hypothetical protein